MSGRRHARRLPHISPALGNGRAGGLATPAPMQATILAGHAATTRGPTTLAVFDPTGRFARQLRDALAPDFAVWPVSRLRLIADPEAVHVVVVAVEQPIEWTDIDALIARGLRTVLLVASGDEAEEEVALRKGAAGYLNLGIPPHSLARAIRAALSGEFVFSRNILGRMLASRRREPDHAGAVAALTARQREIVQLIAAGWTDKEIARRLGIATATAQKHVTNILDRLGVPNRAAAAALAAPVRSDAAGALS